MKKRNPVGLALGSFRMHRGGSWVDSATGCGSAYRESFVPTFRSDFLGLRVVARRRTANAEKA